MPRILLLIILVWVLYVVIKRFMANHAAKKAASKETAESERIVECHHCGLHIPESESHLVDGLTVCNSPNCNKQS